MMHVDAELSPLIESRVSNDASLVRRYGGRLADGVPNGSPSTRMSRRTSIDVLPRDRITLTWSNVSVCVSSDSQKHWLPRCCRDLSDNDALYKQILYNGLS